MEEIQYLIKVYHAQMANAWPGDENDTLDSIEEACYDNNISTETAFAFFENNAN